MKTLDQRVALASMLRRARHLRKGAVLGRTTVGAAVKVALA